MQETLSIKKMHLAIVAAAMAAIVAFSMGIGAQVAQAEEAVPIGKTASTTYKGYKFTFKNNSKSAEGVTLIKVKALKGASKSTCKVPTTVKLNNHTYKSVGIAKNAFKGVKAKKIVLGANVTKINAYAFKGAKATKLYVGKKLTKSIAKKKYLKGSKITKVYAKNKATKLVKKSYCGKAKVKAYKK